MIKVNKDLTNIPRSLKPATAEFFIPPTLPHGTSQTTHQRRQELINQGSYIDNKNYNSRYKHNDIKNILHPLYHKKCAFCEQRSEVPHVEHFRPKTIYYWLAYSWDNLILACSACNSNKGQRFVVSGQRFVFNFDPLTTYRDIHKSCASMDLFEQPLLVNPEVEDLTNTIVFDKLGGIKSTNARLQHTIDECKISRDDLCYQRKKILDDFKKDISAALLENADDHEKQKAEIEVYISQFLRRTKSSEESFLAFRNYAINNNWLGQIIKVLN